MAVAGHGLAARCLKVIPTKAALLDKVSPEMALQVQLLVTSQRQQQLPTHVQPFLPSSLLLIASNFNDTSVICFEGILTRIATDKIRLCMEGMLLYSSNAVCKTLIF